VDNSHSKEEEVKGGKEVTSGGSVGGGNGSFEKLDLSPSPCDCAIAHTIYSLHLLYII